MSDAGGESESEPENARVTDDESSTADEPTGVEAASESEQADESASDPDGEVTETGSEDADAGETASDTTDELIERVASYDEELAAAVESLRDESREQRQRIEELESELADARERAEKLDERAETLESQLARTKADFENYKDRAERKREQVRQRATEDLIERLTEVRNNLVRALDQDDDADIRPGVESTLETFDRVLDEEGVEPIDPEPGTEVDPTRHRVMMRVDSDQPEGTVAGVYQPGYVMGDTVIEEAQVTVSDDE